MKVCAKSLLIAMLFPVAGSALAWNDSFYATKGNFQKLEVCKTGV